MSKIMKPRILNKYTVDPVLGPCPCTGYQHACDDASREVSRAQREALLALAGAYKWLRYAQEHGAFQSAGGDIYIVKGRVVEVLCRELGLDRYQATHTDLVKAIELKLGGE